MEFLGWAILFLVIVALGVWGMVSAVRHARRNENVLRSFEDPETGTSEDDWMNAIR